MVPDEEASTIRFNPARAAAVRRLRVPSTCSSYILRASAGSRLTSPARWYTPSTPASARSTESGSRTPLRRSAQLLVTQDRADAHHQLAPLARVGEECALRHRLMRPLEVDRKDVGPRRERQIRDGRLEILESAVGRTGPFREDEQ